MRFIGASCCHFNYLWNLPLFLADSVPDVQKAVLGATLDAGWMGFAEGGAQGIRPYAFIGGKFCPFGTPSN